MTYGRAETLAGPSGVRSGRSGQGWAGATLPPCLARVHTPVHLHGTDSRRHPWAHHLADHLPLKTSSTVFTPRTANRLSSLPGCFSDSEEG